MKILSVYILVCSAMLSACEGGGGGEAGTNPPPLKGSDDVSKTLSNLNIDTSKTDRVDKNNQALPESYTPVGKSRTLNKKSELYLAGLGLSSSTDHVNILKFEPGVSNVPGVPNKPDGTRKMPFNALDTSWKNDLYNNATRGDVDGDGLEEIVQVWWDSSDNAIRLNVIDDEVENFVESTTSVLTTGDVSWLDVVTGDFNGDGTDEIAVAIVEDAARQITLAFLNGDKLNGYQIDGTRNISFAATQDFSELGIEMVSGQLDLDAGAELALVVNEIYGNGTNQSPATGLSHYYIYDDSTAAMELLQTGRVSADVGTATHSAVVGTLDMGDIDGDGRDEIVLAGLADKFPIRCDAPATVQFIIDDAENDLAKLHPAFRERDQDISSCESSANNSHIEHVWLNTLDIDGDQYAEIQINGVVYEDFVNAATPWDIMMFDTGRKDGSNQPIFQPAIIPHEYIYVANTNGGQNNRSNTTMNVGDFTADGKENILLYAPRTVDIGDQFSSNCNCTFDVRKYAVTVWGIDPLTGSWGKKDLTGREGNIGMLYFEELSNSASSTSAGGPAIIELANVDTDSTMLKFSEGSHEVVFIEPLVHAVLAAPPCYNNGSQVTDNCVTSWGSGTSSGTNASVSHEITARYHSGVSGGVSLPIVGDVGVEVEKSVGVSLKAEASYGYELQKTITYNTGPMEDTVVATVMPYDQYTYKILSHPVYPELVGKDLVISLPRSPRTIQIERQFYNTSLVGDGVRIDNRVFAHNIGDVLSYPSRFDMLSQSDSISLGPVDVGYSSGSTSVEISESRVFGFNATIGINTERSVKATGGKVMAGFSISTNTEATLGFSTGKLVIFTGSVGDLSPASAATTPEYSYGIYVYQQDPGSIQSPFQVINYWVE